jgi:2-amino-4-hydroxy-6-hydroxymethyldihydropteridine diphosphokinase
LPRCRGLVRAFVSLGSNLGDPPANLARAMGRLADLEGGCGARLGRVSGVYLTEPQDRRDQPWFANQAAELLCPPGLAPEDLLLVLGRIEAAMGRVRGEQGGAGERFGPRRIDLDLLLHGDLERNSAVLTLPHPRMRGRAFVLVPLAEIAPEARFPDGTSVAEALANLTFRLEGQRIWQAERFPMCPRPGGEVPDTTTED